MKTGSLRSSCGTKTFRPPNACPKLRNKLTIGVKPTVARWRDESFVCLDLCFKVWMFVGVTIESGYLGTSVPSLVATGSAHGLGAAPLFTAEACG